jgi:TolB-like protein/DNA-binding SARP family transcriptional activator
MVENRPEAEVAPPALPRWQLCVLGEFRLTDQAGTDAAGLGKPDRALLAYLALNQHQRQPRAKLAALLWPGRSEALRSLSVSLNLLRRALGDKDGHLIALKSDPVVCRFQTIDVDALAFADLAAKGTPEALEQAEILYRGDLLDGIDIRSDEFNNWLAAERLRFQGVALDGLCRLIRHREQSGLSQKAFDTARRVLQIDELCEDAHRTTIRLHLEAGQRGAARRHAQYCEQLLRREGVRPEAETERLISECRQAATADSHHSDSPPMPMSSGESGSQPFQTEVQHDTVSPVPARPARRRWLRIGISVFGFRLTISFVMTVALLFMVSSAAVVADNWAVPELARAPLGRYVAWVKQQIWGIAQREPPSIAVLPFEAVGDDPVVAEVAEGIGYELTNALSIVSEMFVVAHYAVLPYEGRRQPIAQVARELGVRYVLEGSVQKSGNRVRIRVNLTEAQQGAQSLWSETYDRETVEIFALQDEITLEIMTNVQVSATEGEKERITKSHGTNNLQAWLKSGRAFKLLRHVREDDNAAARGLYLEATQLDPNYPGAWDGLAWTHLLAARFGWSRSPELDVRNAVQFAETALHLDPTRGRTHSLLGTIRLLMGDFDDAERLGETAVELEPNDADAAALLAHTLTYLDEPNRAVQLIERAMRLSPYYPDWYGWVLARAERLAGEHESALTTLSGVNSKNAVAPLVELILIHGESGRLAEASLAARDLLRLQPNFSVRRFMQVPPYRDTKVRDNEIAELLRAGLPE